MAIATLRVGGNEYVEEIDDGPAGILRTSHSFWQTISQVSVWAVELMEPQSGVTVELNNETLALVTEYIFRQSMVHHYVELKGKVTAT